MDKDLTTKELQALTIYNSRSSFRKYVIDPLLTNNLIYRIRNTNTPHLKYDLKK